MKIHTIVAGCMLAFLAAGTVYADGKVGIYGIHMTPIASDAKEYSRPGWGGGVHGVFPIQEWGNMAAGVVGIEGVNLMSKTKAFIDPVTRLRTEQQTSQNYFRLYVGLELGPHGEGFLRPHGGVNIAGILYNISTDVVIPDDYDGGDTRQSLSSKTKVVFGYDFTFGLDLNFSSFVIDGGVKYLRSFSVPQQLGQGAVTVHPQYFQVYLGVGVPFRVLEGWGNGGDDD
jgi:hypothetical protein